MTTQRSNNLPSLDESVAGEEDPGASLDTSALKPLKPGDEVPAATPRTDEALCRECGGSGRTEGGNECRTCDGTGKVTVGVGGG